MLQQLRVGVNQTVDWTYKTPTVDVLGSASPLGQVLGTTSDKRSSAYPLPCPITRHSATSHYSPLGDIPLLATRRQGGVVLGFQKAADTPTRRRRTRQVECYRSLPKDVGGESWGQRRRFSIWRLKKVQNPTMVWNGVQDNRAVSQGCCWLDHRRQSRHLPG